MSPEVGTAIGATIVALLSLLLTYIKRHPTGNSERPPKPEVKVVYVGETELRALIREEVRSAMRGSYHD